MAEDAAEHTESTLTHGADAPQVETRDAADAVARAPDLRVRITPRAIGAVFLVGLVLAAGAGALIGGTRLVALLWPVISFLLTTAFLAILLNPVVGWLMRRRISRGLAIGIVLLAFVSIIPLLAAIILPRLVHQLNDLVASLVAQAQQPTGNVSTIVSFAEDHGAGGYVTAVREQVAQNLPTAMAHLFGALVSLVTGFVTHLTLLLILLFVLIMLLRDGEGFVAAAVRHFPSSSQPRLQQFLAQSAAAFYRYLGGKLILSLLCAVAIFVVLLILQMPNPLALALLVGLFDLIPLVGAILAGFLVAFVGLFKSPLVSVFLVVYFFIYQQIEDSVLQPLVFGRTNRLHPLAVLIAILVGMTLFGVLGAILAIPTAEIIRLGYETIRESRSDSEGAQMADGSEQQAAGSRQRAGSDGSQESAERAPS
jgi:predicted PurR-regulated permease PerM